MRKVFVAALVMLACAQASSAQTPIRAEYDFGVIPLSVVQAWTPVLYVNGIRFPRPSHACTQSAPTTVTCSFVLPDISMALTPTGPQTFEVSAVDLVLGEGPKSAPLERIRPGAPSPPRFVSP